MKNSFSDIKFGRGVPVKDGLSAMLWCRPTLLVLAGVLSLALCFSNSVHAQEQNSQDAEVRDVTEEETDEQVPPQPLPEKEIVRLDQMQENIVIQKEDIVQLEGQIDKAEGLIRDIFVLRRDRLWTEMFQGTLNLAKGRQ